MSDKFNTYVKYKEEYSNKFVSITSNFFKEGLKSIYDNTKEKNKV